MPADPQHPVPPRGPAPSGPVPPGASPAPAGLTGMPAEAARALMALGVSLLAAEEDQDQVLAWELAAFPAEDDPYHDDPREDDPSEDDPWLAGLPGEVLADYLAATTPAPATTAPAPADGLDARAPVASASPSVSAGATAGAGAGFAESGTADAMTPGPVLAGLADQVWQGGLGGLTDDELTGVMRAWQRLGARAAAGLLAAASELAARRKAQAQADGDWRAFEYAEDEIAAALTLTLHSAGRVLGLALGLDRLPLTRAALAAGAIDERRAALISDELAGLDDEHAAAVEASIITDAPGQTTGELRPALRRAVIAADPSAAKRRKERALKDARVEAFTEPAGTAALSGRDLPPAGVLAADKHLTALAMAMKKAGAEGTMDQLRARAYLHLLAGQPAETLLTPGTPGHKTPTTSTASTAPGTGNADTGTARTGTAGTGPAGTGAPGLGLPALRGTVNLTVPLATWLGWSQSPGQVPGFGTLDAGDSNTIAALLARDPATQWCLTLTDPAGHAIAHGCAKTGPRPPGQPPPGPGSWPGPDSGADPGTGPPAGPGPPGDPGWVAAVPITPVQAGDCSHPRQTPGYQPGAALRHIIEIRQATCCHPGCRRPATRCDLDHTIAHHLGGRTCECGLAPLCRRHHQAKQAPGWALAQNQPGTMTWTTPAGRTYTTGPTSYPN